ncbi:MAG: citramalate synthase [Rhodobacteraceae bacterium]|nr:citramalate synthase [Paracoccaceae bacterium]
MTQERLYLYDTTLRDGQQTQGVQFSTAEKLHIVQMLDALGVDYIEGGWPGANPTDSAFFEQCPPTKATLSAFGMTKRAGRSAGNDDILAQVVNAGTDAICLVGKSHLFHVKTALNISPQENLDNIAHSIHHLRAQGREILFDAEHFFDGFRDNPDYALATLQAAYQGGARWVVLCDTNGGSLPHDIHRATQAAIAAGVPPEHLGIHAHNDCEQAVANSLAAVEAGARQIQGTLNGLGERCGNANLITLIGILALKEPYASRYKTRIGPAELGKLTRTSRRLDDILNRLPAKQAAFVGSSAFAHKAGLHASAILKHPATYEHIEPALVGNARVIPMSNQAGRSNLRNWLNEVGIQGADETALDDILTQVKQREAEGYSYDSARASFELLARRALGLLPRFFEVERHRVRVEGKQDAEGRIKTMSKALVIVKIGGIRRLSVSESADSQESDNQGMNKQGEDRGPVNALYRALAKNMGPYQSVIHDFRLVDFKVRITQGGTEAITRVIIDSADSKGRRWSTVGVDANIVAASLEALLDAINWKLLHEGAPPAVQVQAQGQAPLLSPLIRLGKAGPYSAD